MTANTIDAHFKHTYSHENGKSFSLNIDTSLPGKGITAIFGHSGSGKTTLLRCIAGLQKIEEGFLSVNGSIWQDRNRFLATHKRPIGYVFQESSLFPHLTARSNLSYAIKRSNNTRAAQTWPKVSKLMDIDSVMEKYPAQLSGGERQRVAIARALLIGPQLLLMDEPLASLDHARKQEIMPYLERLRDEYSFPILYVSHSVDEVARLADYMLVLNAGEIETEGTTTEVLSSINPSIQSGEDLGVVLHASIIERDEQWHLAKLSFPGGELWLRESGDALHQSIRIRILARDVSLSLENHDDTSILNKLYANVIDISNDIDEAMSLVRLKVGATIIISRVTRRSVETLQLASGHKVWAQIKSVAIVR